MKKIILAVALALWGFSAVVAQSNEEGIVTLYATQKKWEDAKNEVDKWLATPKLKGDDKQSALLWKLVVYSQISVEPSLSAKYPNAADQALDAFYEYKATDPTLKKLKEGNFSAGLGNLYSGDFNKGKDYFQKKDWSNAYKSFSQASRLANILLENKLSSSTATIDTVTVLYTGYSAQNAQMQDSAAVYYGMIAGLNVGGPDYEDIYKYLVQYYSDKKDDANFKKYLAQAKALYPNDVAMWTQFEMNNMTANTSITDLLHKYQTDVAAGGMTEDKYIGYAEALATNDQSQLQNLDSLQKMQIRMAAAQAYGKAFEINNTNGLYAYNVGVMYYGAFQDLDDRYHANAGQTAALKARRAEIAVQEAKYADTAAQWLEKAYAVLKAKQDRTKPETASLNRAVDWLANIYMWERDQTKVNGNSKDYDKYDALFKKYDAEHNAYQ